MQAHLEWKKFQFKRSVIQSDNSASNANDGGLINFKSGLYSFLSIVAFVGLLIGTIFFTVKRMGQNYYIVDRLFGAAELRLGDKNSERRVRIIRTDGRRRS